MSEFSTDCKGCGEPMVEPPHAKSGWLAHAKSITTGYLCKKCNHWNDLKRRKGWAEYKAHKLA